MLGLKIVRKALAYVNFLKIQLKINNKFDKNETFSLKLRDLTSNIRTLNKRRFEPDGVIKCIYLEILPFIS